MKKIVNKLQIKISNYSDQIYSAKAGNSEKCLHWCPDLMEHCHLHQCLDFILHFVFIRSFRMHFDEKSMFAGDKKGAKSLKVKLIL